jgi:hypothetical protein
MKLRRKRSAVLFGSEPCTRLPLKNSTSPGSMSTGTRSRPGGGGTKSRVKETPGSASSGQNRSIRCVPGTTSRPPFARSTRSSATHAATQVPGSTRR